MTDWRNNPSEEEEWQVPSDMDGLGPRTFEVTEDTVLKEVHRKLAEENLLERANISVHVDEGEVTLNGSVPSHAAMQMAEDAAASIEGVFSVTNRLHVQR